MIKQPSIFRSRRTVFRGCHFKGNFTIIHWHRLQCSSVCSVLPSRRGTEMSVYLCCVDLYAVGFASAQDEEWAIPSQGVQQCHGDICYLLKIFCSFKKMKADLRDLHTVCVFVYPPINFWVPELIFMKLGVYIIVPEPHLNCLLHNPSH
jgi:hypothetical protein